MSAGGGMPRKKRQLGDRISEYLAGTGRPQTSRDIARALRVRHVDVLEALKTDFRFYPWPTRDRSKPYGVRADSEDGEGGSGAREQSGAAA